MTTPTTQPDPEQIAREIAHREISEWYLTADIDNGYISKKSGADLEKRLTTTFASALQAAKQQGREEVIKNSIELLGRGCERHVEIIRKQSFAEFRENYPACQWCLAEEVRTLQQQPKSEPSQECMEIAREIAGSLLGCHSHKIWQGLGAGGLESVKVRDLIAEAFLPALQAKQDELDALREEVLGVIEPFAECADRANAFRHPDDSTCVWRFEAKVLRAALALRDKLKASQPTLPRQQTPHQ